jgi:hypothetical protein
VLAEADMPALAARAALAALAALREVSPLLFDLALKRRLRRDGAALADAVFATRRHFERGSGTAPAPR